MTGIRTGVSLHYLPDRINHWLRFGRPVTEIILDRRRRFAQFESGQVCGYVRWQANDYGTVLWRLYVLRAGRPGERLVQVPGVVPGADRLLRLDRPATVKPALAVIDALEEAGYDPADVAPEYWQHVQNRLAVGDVVRPYAADQHRAWRARQGVLA